MKKQNFNLIKKSFLIIAIVGLSTYSFQLSKKPNIIKYSKDLLKNIEAFANDEAGITCNYPGEGLCHIASKWEIEWVPFSPLPLRRISECRFTGYQFDTCILGMID